MSSMPSTERCQKETGYETNNPLIRLGMLLSSSQKWIGEGKSPSMWVTQMLTS